MLNLRPATISDVPTILRFIRELAEFEKLLHEVEATEEKLRQTLFGADARAEVIIAERAGVAEGIALYFTSYSTFLAKNGIYLEDLYVSPASRGQGIGTALLRRLAQIALDRGAGRLEWSVLDWNEKAIALYRKMGATPQAEWTVQRVTGKALETLAQRNA
jgi:GNAT superfamily N-acetyltransferase